MSKKIKDGDVVRVRHNAKELFSDWAEDMDNYVGKVYLAKWCSSGRFQLEELNEGKVRIWTWSAAALELVGE